MYNLLHKDQLHVSALFIGHLQADGDRGSTVVKVLCYKSEIRWFDPSWYQWNFH